MFDENKYKVFCYEEKNADGSARCPVVCAMSTYAGKNVKGYAKLNEGDEWNWETGKALAIARCNAKIAEKRMKRAQKKVIEAQEILDDATGYLSDMVDYCADSTDEYMAAKSHVADLIAKMS